MGTSRIKSRRRPDQGFKWARISIAIMSTIGVIDTGSITLSRWGLWKTICPGNSGGCDSVLNSPWGTIFQNDGFSIPLSFIGFISYLSILLLAVVPLLPSKPDSGNNFSRNTWWGLFIISCTMTIFSLVLIWLMIFKINEFCFFCALSALLSTFIFLLTIIGGGWEEPGELLFRGTLLSIAVLLSGFIWSSAIEPTQANSNKSNAPPIVRSQSNISKIELAKHLKSTGAVMYSAYWCPHCHDQKEMFGKEASEELSIIECAADGINNQRSLCEQKGITGFPSWEINNTITSGTRSLEDLASLSDYKGANNNF